MKEAEGVKKPNSKMVTVWIIAWFVSGMLLSLTFVLPVLLVSLVPQSSSGMSPFWALVSWIAFLIVYGLAVALASILYYNSWSYSLEEDYLTINFGILWKKTNRIPYARIQNVNVVRGPLLRIFGLCKVQVETAGKSASVSSYGFYSGGPEAWIPGPIEGEQIAKDILKRVKELHGAALSSGL